METITRWDPVPEFKKYSLENFGQIIKVSADLEPNVFPYRVAVPREGHFFQYVYNRVLLGKGTPSERLGNSIERSAIVGANDLGEFQVSNKIYEGDNYKSLTDKSAWKFSNNLFLLKNYAFPAGWRTFATLHSHPLRDIRNHIELFSTKSIPRVNNIPVTWTLGDFQVFIHRVKQGHNGITTSVLITPIQLGFMVASKTTVEAIKADGQELNNILASERSAQETPPYKLFEKYGVILYGGNHFRRQKGETELQRLT